MRLLRRRVFALLPAGIGCCVLLPSPATGGLTGDGRNAAPPSNQEADWNERELTPGVVISFEERGRTRRDKATEIEIQINSTGAPVDKTYVLWFRDLGMVLNDQPPVSLEPFFGSYQVDAAGKWTPALPKWTVWRFQKGEWVEFRLASTDGTVTAVGRYTPFPIEGRDGTCHVELELITADASALAVHGEGFPPGEEVITESRSDDELVQGTQVVEPNGSLPDVILLSETVKRAKSHPASYTVRASKCVVKVDYEWGKAAGTIQ